MPQNNKKGSGQPAKFSWEQVLAPLEASLLPEASAAIAGGGMPIPVRYILNQPRPSQPLLSPQMIENINALGGNVADFFNGIGSSQYIGRDNMRNAYLAPPEPPTPYYAPRMYSPEEAMMYMDLPISTTDRLPRSADLVPIMAMPESQLVYTTEDGMMRPAARRRQGALERAGQAQYVNPQNRID